MVGRRIYRELKIKVTNGEFLADERLDPALLARELQTSETTIRNALRRLATKRLVVARPREAFYNPTATDAALRGTYAWAHDVLLMALRNVAPIILPPVEGGSTISAGDSLVSETELLFAEIAALPGIVEYQEAMATANNRLRAVRRLEARFIEDREDERRNIHDLLKRQAFDHLGAALSRYYDRRVPLVPDLVRLRHSMRLTAAG